MVGTPNNGVNGSPENGVYGTPNYGMGGTPNSVRTRLVYSAQEPSPGSAAVSIVDSDYGSIEFSKEDVEVLLNEKARVKSRYNFKERCEAMSDYIRRLRQCIRWFQQLEGCYEIDQDHLRAMLESSEQKCGEIEMLLRNKEEELNTVIMELRKNYTTMEEKLAKADSEKMATMDSLCKEREARQESEKFRESVSEELARAQRDLQSASQQISVLTDTHKRAQDYNINLQQYNCKLQEDLDIANDNLKQAEKEKATVAENLNEQRVQNTVLLEQLTSIKASHDDVMNQKDELVNEVACLKKELQQMKDDCDQKQFQVEELMAEAAEYKESRDEVIKQKYDLVNEVACLRKELQQIKDDRDGKLLQVEKLMAEAAEFKDFHDEVMKQKDELVNEVACLRKELQQIKDDCDRKQLQVEELMAEAAEYKDSRDEVIKKKEELVNEVASLSKELQKMRDDRDSKLLQVEELMAEAVEHKESYDEVIKQKDELVNEVASHKKELQKISDDRDCKLLQVEELMAEVATHKNSNAKLVAELDSLTVKSNELEARCGSQIDQIKTLEDRLTAAEQMLEMSDLSAIETRSVSEGHKKLIRELQTSLANAEFKLIEGEKLRKKLHNTILELKGNIRVFCRVRPLLPEDNSSTEGKIISFPSSLEAVGRGIDLVHNGQKHSFSFDQVFMPDASQEDVFVEISQLVQSALDGYKVCIFAYGQTGSGKTHTMMGRPGHPGQKGLIPRSLEQIFKTIQSLESQGWKYEMQVSMLEIYNETIRDLLSTNRSSLDTLKMENGSAGKQYVIKHDAHGNTYVSDLTVVDVRSTKEVSYLLNQAAHSRSVGKTQMNEYSSRSHFVFTLKMSGVNESTDQQVQGVLNLIDLAGSERLSKSGSTGDRLKETQAINKSLSSLGDVIFSLAKRDDHIPFRNSKLTYLLQPCLGGDSKTLMFVNISPDSTSANESLCSLRFASRVNACEIGTPRRQTNMRSTESRLSYG